MRKYAILNNNVVTEIRQMSESEYVVLSGQNQLIIDVESMSQQPAVGWLLVGNSLQAPSGSLTQEEQLRIIVGQYRVFGEELSKQLNDKVGARNLMLGKTEAEISALVNTLISIGILLEKGALKTAGSVMLQVKPGFSEYSDIFDYGIEAITAYVGA